jgi:membrane protease YdiL (CAAX protease family)
MRLPPWFLAVIGTLLVWLLTARLPWPARAMTAVLVGALPVMAVAQLRGLHDPRELPRLAAYASTIVTLWVLAGLCILASVLTGYQASDVFLVWIGWERTLAWACGLTAATVLFTVALRKAGLRESDFVLHLLPVTRTERMTFAALSVTAGIAEELIFRCFLFATLTAATGSFAFAVVVATVVFGWAHAYQQAGGAVRAATLGALLALPLVLTGSAIPSMIAHTLIDLIGGFWLRDRGQGRMACLLHF